MSTARRWLIAYAVTVVAFTLVDGVWIALVASGVYRAQLGPLLADPFDAVAAAVFYLGYVAGLVHFGIQPLAVDVPLGRRSLAGALYGLFTYGTWGLTALAVLRGFPAFVAVTDIAWGVALGALVTSVASLLLRRLGVLGTDAGR
ncbi:MAG: DUF2177 family protein [Propionicimonas sp.]